MIREDEIKLWVLEQFDKTADSLGIVQMGYFQQPLEIGWNESSIVIEYLQNNAFIISLGSQPVHKGWKRDNAGKALLDRLKQQRETERTAKERADQLHDLDVRQKTALIDKIKFDIPVSLFSIGIALASLIFAICQKSDVSKARSDIEVQKADILKLTDTLQNIKSRVMQLEQPKTRSMQETNKPDSTKSAKH
jgi:hypothetical protein